MKLNLMYGPGSPLSGYENISHTQTGPVNNLDLVCEDAECDSIIAEDVIDYFSSKEVDKLLIHWLAKLRHSGTIIVGGLDIKEIAKAISNKQIDIIQANKLIYGEQSEPYQFRKSGLSSTTVVEALRSFGLKILKNRTHNYHYIVEAERP